MKTVVICVSALDESFEVFKTFKDSPLLRDAQVHLVHCFETQVYTGEFFMGTFPAPDQYSEIEKSILLILEGLEKELGGERLIVKKKCLFSGDAKEAVREYLQENKADLAVLATRGKHGIEGFFSSSFGDYMMRHSPCDIHILRPKR